MSLFLIMELFKLPSSWYPFTALKVPKYGVIPGTLFSVFSPNTGKYGPEITPYLDTFHAVFIIIKSRVSFTVAIARFYH